MDAPNLHVDITAGIDKKIEALRCYASIIANGTFDPEAVRAFHRMRGHTTFRHEYAESFRLVRGFIGRR